MCYACRDSTKLRDGSTPLGRVAEPFFFGDDDAFRDDRFKMTPRVVDANWVVRRAVGQNPPREYSPRCVTEFGAPLAIYPPPPPVAPGAAGRHNYYAATSPPEAKKRDRYTTTYNQGGTDFKFTTKAANVPSTPKSPRSQWARPPPPPPPPRPLDAPAADSPVSPQSERSWRSVSPVLSPPGVLRSPRYRIKPGAYDQLFASSGGRDGDELPFALDGDDGDAGVSADDDGAVPAALIARFRPWTTPRPSARALSPPPSLSSDDEDDAPPPPPPEPHPIWAGDSDSDDREVAGATAKGWGPPGAEAATFHKSTLFAHQALSKAPPVVVATPRADSKEMFAGDVPSPRLQPIGALHDPEKPRKPPAPQTRVAASGPASAPPLPFSRGGGRRRRRGRRRAGLFT
ncbi:hypothetical protein JL722_4838 [Aureococcus anophagefferens]|nr:hypothetical protein JL722_4838 [Aureococcus anophagefferens]